MIGPQDQWEAELETLSKEGLIFLVKSVLTTLTYFGVGRDRDDLLRSVRHAKKLGRTINLTRRIDKFLADPTGVTRHLMRRCAAAKKAARRRKKEKKAA